MLRLGAVCDTQVMPVIIRDIPVRKRSPRPFIRKNVGLNWFRIPVGRCLICWNWVAHICRSWKFPCSSQIQPYWRRVKSGVNTEISNPAYVLKSCFWVIWLISNLRAHSSRESSQHVNELPPPTRTHHAIVYMPNWVLIILVEVSCSASNAILSEKNEIISF